MWVRFWEGESFFYRKLLRDYRRYKCFVWLLNAGECPLLGLASSIVTAVFLALCLLCLSCQGAPVLSHLNSHRGGLHVVNVAHIVRLAVIFVVLCHQH